MAILKKLLAASIFLAVSTAFAQTSTATAPATTAAFDVASVRENTTHDRHTHSSIYNLWTSSRFTATNVPLKMLIEFATGMPESHILGGPDWLDTATFDIEAKSDPAVDQQMSKLTTAEAKPQKLAMLLALLADRFQLVTHTETRELPIYALIQAKDGAKLKPNTHGNYIGGSKNTLTVQGGDDSLAILADRLTDIVGRTVLNRTGMTGRFDITLKWTPDTTESTDAPSDPNAPPNIFTAIQEQLGLKLEPSKGPVPILVIDSVHMPSAN